MLSSSLSLGSSATLVSLLSLLSAPVFAAPQYVQKKAYKGQDFVNQWSLFDGADPTNGFVTYSNKQTSLNDGRVTFNNNRFQMRVDSTTQLSTTGPGRGSVRIEENSAWTKGLFVADIAQMPERQCGIWPAWWTLGTEAPWPAGGEIDILEGVNEKMYNLASLHTGTTSKIVNDNSLFTGTLQTSDCNVNTNGPYSNYVGCGILDNDPNSFGTPVGGSNPRTVAMEWTDTYIKVWNFASGSRPSDILSSSPDPSKWGTPSQQLTGNDVDLMANLKANKMIFDTTLCGDWAGGVWTSDGCAAKTGYATCNAYVAANPQAFANTFWDIAAVNVYQVDATSTSSTSSSSTSSSTSTSSSVSSSSTSSSSTSTSSASTTPSSTTSSMMTSSTTMSTSTRSSSSSSSMTTSTIALSPVLTSTSSSTSSSSMTSSTTASSSTGSSSSSSTMTTSTITLSPVSTSTSTSSSALTTTTGGFNRGPYGPGRRFRLGRFQQRKRQVDESFIGFDGIVAKLGFGTASDFEFDAQGFLIADRDFITDDPTVQVQRMLKTVTRPNVARFSITADGTFVRTGGTFCYTPDQTIYIYDNAAVKPTDCTDFVISAQADPPATSSTSSTTSTTTSTTSTMTTTSSTTTSSTTSSSTTDSSTTSSSTTTDSFSLGPTALTTTSSTTSSTTMSTMTSSSSTTTDSFSFNPTALTTSSSTMSTSTTTDSFSFNPTALTTSSSSSSSSMSTTTTYSYSFNPTALTTSSTSTSSGYTGWEQWQGESSTTEMHSTTSTANEWEQWGTASSSSYMTTSMPASSTWADWEKMNDDEYITTTITEVYVVPCPTGYETKTATMSTAYPKTQTMVPHMPVATYVTSCPAEWGFSGPVTVTVPVTSTITFTKPYDGKATDAAGEWNNWVPAATTSKPMDAMNTWAQWNTATAPGQSSQTWAEWNTATVPAQSSQTWAEWNTATVPAKSSQTWGEWNNWGSAMTSSKPTAGMNTWAQWGNAGTSTGPAQSSQTWGEWNSVSTSTGPAQSSQTWGEWNNWGSAMTTSQPASWASWGASTMSTYTVPVESANTWADWEANSKPVDATSKVSEWNSWAASTTSAAPNWQTWAADAASAEASYTGAVPSGVKPYTGGAVMTAGSIVTVFAVAFAAVLL